MSELRGRILVDGHLHPGSVAFRDGRITAVQENVTLTPAEAELVIAPGLIDLHVHGFGGAEPISDLPGMARALARAGTTAFQPTLFPAAPGELGELCGRIWRGAEALRLDPAGAGAARVLGLHLEGPFVNPRAAGALPREGLAEPSPAALAAILGAATGDGRGVRTMTLAPELPGAAELIGELRRAHVRVSLGHSLARTAEARAALRAGAIGVTHLYNAMRGFHHREAGLAGVALTEDQVFCEIIGDLVHVGPEAFDLAVRARGPLGLCLVSDALAGAGTGCQRFHGGGREHVAREGAFYLASGGAAPEPGQREPRGGGPGGARGGGPSEGAVEGGAQPILAGSACSQLEMVRRLVEAEVAYLEDALTMATSAPARALGLAGELGELSAGARADLIALRGEGLELAGVWVDGRRMDDRP